MSAARVLMQSTRLAVGFAVLMALGGCSAAVSNTIKPKLASQASAQAITTPAGPAYLQSAVQVEVRGDGFMASGSGTIIDKQGNVLTLAVLVARASLITVSTASQTYGAAVAGSDAGRNLALLRLDAGTTAFTPADLGTNADIFPGADVRAIGYPFLNGTLAPSAAINMGKAAGLATLAGQDYVRASAIIAPGCAGGSLVTADGKMVGVLLGEESPVQNTAAPYFAVPIDAAMEFVQSVTGK